MSENGRGDELSLQSTANRPAVDGLRARVIAELESACLKALTYTEGAATLANSAVSIAESDGGDTRTVCFEGESILDAITTMDTTDIAGLIHDVLALQGVNRG